MDILTLVGFAGCIGIVFVFILCIIKCITECCNFEQDQNLHQEFSRGSVSPVRNDFIERFNRDHVIIQVEEPTSYRQEASKCKAKRTEFTQLSKKARKQKKIDLARRYSHQAVLWKTRMEAANKKAADEFFRKNNPPGNIELDLHDLFVKEAIDRLKQRVSFARRQGCHKLTVIVGRGLHSTNGPKIKPAVINYAIEKGIKYHANSPRIGCITLIFVT